MTPALRTHRVVVVGGGVGGLTAAAALARQGLDVTLLERANDVGGKLRQVSVGGHGVDAGPTVFTMRWVFEGLFAEAGLRLEDELVLTPVRTLARHAWSSGGQLDLFADPQRSAEAIGVFAGPAEARRYLAFAAQSREVYNTLEGPYIRSARPSLPSMMSDLGLHGSAVLFGLGPFRDLATLMLVAHVEQQGVWTVGGGMVEIGRALARLAQRNGAQIRTASPVESIELNHGKVSAVVLAGGERLPADSVVFNGDVAALAQGLLGSGVQGAAPAITPQARSLSAMTWCLHAQTRGLPLVHHNVFFDDDYRSEFRDIFGHGRLPRKGTVYLCAQDRHDDDADIHQRERLLALVNAPAIGDLRQLDPEEIEQCHTNAMTLMQRCGLQLEHDPQQTVLTTPQDFERLFPATGGALYGEACHGWMASFRRPASSTAIPGLYLAGGSAHPGPGVPMAAMSGRLAAATLMAHLDSTSPSRRVAISGGTSMP
ncbi:MAG: FAD-dependent oxidoreductase [Betaproteobacteria bacterium]|nr:FAD-dependent oxidoreductase [Betaproteobacteria bacterium]